MPPPRTQPLTPPLFATLTLPLLSAELAAETALTTALLSSPSSSPRLLSRAGLALINLSLSNTRTGLGGKTVLVLEPDAAVTSATTSSGKAGAARKGGKGGGRGQDTNGEGEGGEGGESGVRVGDVVRVARQPKGGERKGERRELEGGGVQGVVVKVRGGGLEVAVEREAEEGWDGGGGRNWVVKLANEVTYKRMNWTLERMQKMEESDYTTLMRILFGLESPTPLPKDLKDPERGAGKVEFFDTTLNDSQKDAVRFALASKEVALIHGPPGTGKTYTLIELILQLLQRKQRVLVCGPSNISVDNIVERLAPHKVPIIRLGHPARLLPSVLSHSLDVLTRTSEAAELVKDIRKEMDDKQASIKKTRSGRERKAIYSEMKELRSEYKEREKKCVSTLVQGSKVVLATLHGAGGSQLRQERFDVVIIDEASQALEAQCWIPLLNASKVVLAGDHLQLPPTIKSTNTKSIPERSKDKPKDKSKDKEEKSKTKDEQQGPHQASDKTTTSESSKPLSSEAPTPKLSLETTLFSRLLSLHGPSIKRLLNTQYRMHENIMSFPSQELYEGKLIAADSVKARLLKDLPYPVEDTDDTREPLIFWDTQGGDFPEQLEDDEDADNNGGGKTKITKSTLLGDSKSNPSEALIVLKHVNALISAGVHAEDIAVITPYNAQLSILSRMLRQRFLGLELGSVDGFQGREKEAVVVSLVRSNSDKEVGFLAEKRRLNVAMTRPKRHLCVIGDSETVGGGGGGFLKRWMAWLEEKAEVRFPDLGEVQEIKGN